MLPLFDLNTATGRDGLKTRLDRLRDTASLAGEQAQVVAEIVTAIRRNGDAELVRQMRRWTDPDFSSERIRVGEDELEAAEKNLSGPLRDAITRSIEHVRAYQLHILPQSPKPVVIDGADLGLRFAPVDSAGLTVPGGTAVLFSTVIMLAVPARVAGVPADQLSVVNPPPTRRADQPPGDISPVVLATCSMVGIRKVYRIGGAAAVAALAFGTDTVEPVDLIAGPGNLYVQLAKQIVTGYCGSDGGFYGPSEIAIVADDSANPAWIAADLIAQAEHDPGKCFLVSWSRRVIERVFEQIGRQLPDRQRRGAIEAALRDESCAVLAGDETGAIEVANRIACEHVSLAVADPEALLGRVRHGGEIFLGHQTPVACGDYFAGPSHCLPTATTARFTSGVSVYTFLRRTGTVCYRDGLSPHSIEAVTRLAAAEGLDGHAQSVQARRG